MKAASNRILTLLLALALAVSLSAPSASAAPADRVDAPLEQAALRLRDRAPVPASSIGGEWAVVGLARSGTELPRSYYQDYYDGLVQHVSEHRGVLHARKYTEYARVLLALTAIGADPENVGGYDLLAPLADYDRVVWQGVNGPAWALIALDSGRYPMPKAPAGAGQATRRRYLDHILASQLPDGGWSVTDREPSDPDMTAMVLQALAGYRVEKQVDEAVERGLALLSRSQQPDGGYVSGGVPNAESCAQVVLALCALELDPGDSRFVKNGRDPLDALLSYRLPDGSFRHKMDGGSDRMATEQAFLALTAARRTARGETALFRMTEPAVQVDTRNPAGLPGRHADVRFRPVVRTGVTFTDTADPAVLALAARDLVSGVGDGRYLPEATMLRCEFASAVVRTLGLPGTEPVVYSDVAPSAWYAAPVSTAGTYDIVSGVGGGSFAPGNTITRQEGMVMLTKAARLAGLDTSLTGQEINRLLAGFDDAHLVQGWARSSVAFCLKSGILDVRLELSPERPISRGEMANFLYRLMDRAALL